MENRPVAPKARGRRIGLADLFAMMGLIMPVFAAIAQVKQSGGGVVAYLVAALIGVGLGVLISTVEWRLGRAIWRRFERYSSKVQNAVGFSLFVIQLLWVFLGVVSGIKVGAFAGSRFAH